MVELPNPANFDAVSQFVREDDIAELVPCGPDADPIVAGVREFAEGRYGPGTGREPTGNGSARSRSSRL
jgi:hypothetical protein